MGKFAVENENAGQVFLAARTFFIFHLRVHFLTRCRALFFFFPHLFKGDSSSSSCCWSSVARDTQSNLFRLISLFQTARPRVYGWWCAVIIQKGRDKVGDYIRNCLVPCAVSLLFLLLTKKSQVWHGRCTTVETRVTSTVVMSSPSSPNLHGEFPSTETCDTRQILID
jgi:hypothetical protein